MAIYFDIVDMMSEYKKVKNTAIIINDLDITLSEDMEKFNRLVFTNTGDAPIQIVPQCRCGYSTGAVLIGNYTCPKCDTPVRRFAESIRNEVWIRRPEGGPGFMLPYAYIVFSRISLKGINLQEFMLNKTYSKTIRKEQEIYWNILNDILPPEYRNYSYFYYNFIEIMKEIKKRLDSLRAGLSGQDDFRVFYKNFVEERSDILFTDYLPVVSNLLLTKERSAKGIYVMRETPDYVNALLQICGIDDSYTEAEIAKRVKNYMDGCAVYFYNFTKTMIDTKEGISRKNRSGARMPFSFRAVVSSIPGKHHSQELHMPWKLAIEVFRPILINRLSKLGHSPREIENKLMDAYFNYDMDIDNIFQQLIDESKYPGIPALVNRNPSIWAGSLFLLYITKIKKDIDDVTQSISILTTTPPNCDFDGDELNVYIMPDNYTTELLKIFEPHNVIPDNFMPREVHRSFTIPKPSCGVFNTLLQET